MFAPWRFQNPLRITADTITGKSFIYCDFQKHAKNRNKQNGSKSINHNWQTQTFDPVEANFCFLSSLLRWLTTAKNLFRSCRWLEQSSRVSENRTKNTLRLISPYTPSKEEHNQAESQNQYSCMQVFTVLQVGSCFGFEFGPQMDNWDW